MINKQTRRMYKDGGCHLYLYKNKCISSYLPLHHFPTLLKGSSRLLLWQSSLFTFPSQHSIQRTFLNLILSSQISVKMRQQASLNILAILLATGLLSSTGLAAPGPSSADDPPSGNRKRTPNPAPAPPIVKVTTTIADALAEAAQKAQIDDLINKIAKTASDNVKSFIKVRRTTTETETIGKKGDDNAKSYIRRQKLALLAAAAAEQEAHVKRGPQPGFGDVIEGLVDVVVDEEAAKKAAEEAAKKIAKAGADAASGLIKKRRREAQIEQIKKEMKSEPQPATAIIEKRQSEVEKIKAAAEEAARIAAALAAEKKAIDEAAGHVKRGFGDVIEGLADVVVDDDAAKKAAEEAAKKAAKKAADAAAGLIKRREQIERINKEMR
ncbi:hypothetical protein QBC37DRAFT_425275 [Rhypophila decipiens]|uniref:Uncharacterized protein n=1 Tax=Rhypophila decipiens TaxID=261697 RepID=A0AAN6Y4U6_9PEZI|nr:hypothetical protein QBC37DRAFT_425275 [Rhypophila decipiens]